ncbi:tetratricopeptide repeat protein [Clostridium paridis]|uniref:Tetratricopeptide repeat protein n=1 Tax=Clostridium paridis TaxID=2803863 RepID=A0A937K3Z3_9CLOT|nr:tetratricopeptide repeat protein [Clostridium paridis]MBL4932112.1 tetratricopeptide repeat protein [Clostridium paridis]
MGKIKELLNKLKKNGEPIKSKLIKNAIKMKEKSLTIYEKLKVKIDPFIKKYKALSEKWSILHPTVVMIFCFMMALIIIFSVKTALKKNQTLIANNKAEMLFYQGDFDKSVSEYEKLQEDDKWPIWEVKEAEIYSVQGEMDKSNDLLKDAMDKRNKIVGNNREKYEAKDRELVNYIVFTYFMNKNYKEALEIGESELNNYGKDKPLMRTMYTVYMVNGEKDKASEMVKEYPVDSDSAYDLSILAKMQMLLDDYDKGFDLLKEAWYKDKDEIKVFDIISQAATFNKDLILQKLIDRSSKEPNEICYKLWIAKVYSMSQDSADMAQKTLTELDGKDIGNINVKIIQAKIYQYSGDNEKGEKLLNEIISQNSESYIGYHTAGWYYYDKGEYDKAFEFAQKSILANKDYPDNYGFLIPDIMLKQGKDKEAEPYFRAALLKEPFNYDIMAKIANYYWTTAKDSNKAYEYFSLASQVKPTDTELYYNMALIKLNSNSTDDAIALLKKAISLDDANPKYHRTLGTVYMNQEKYSDAIKEVRYAYAADKNDPLTLNNAGCFYISINVDLERGMANLKAAYESRDSITDADTKKAIEENYTKAKTVYDDYNKGNGDSIKIPDFTLFY